MVPKKSILFIIIFTLILIFGAFFHLYQAFSTDWFPEVDVYNWAANANSIAREGDVSKYKSEIFPEIAEDSPQLLPISAAIIKLIIGVDFVILFKFYGPIITLLGGIFVFLICRRVFNTPIGLFSFFLYTFMPILQKRSVITLSENYAYLFLPLTFYLVTKIIKDEDSFSSYLILIFLIPIGLFSHQSNALLIILFTVGLLISLYTPNNRKIKKIHIIGGILAIAIIIISIYPSIFGVISFQARSSLPGGIENKSSVSFDQYPETITYPFISFLILGCIFLFKRDRKIFILLIVYLAAIFTIISILPAFGISNNPARFFPYFALVGIIPFSATFYYFYIQKKKIFLIFSIALVVLILIKNPLIYNWEITSKGEIEAYTFLKNSNVICTVITQPANWNQLRLFAEKEVYKKITPTNKDYTSEIFTLTNPEESYAFIKNLEEREYCIFISLYKLDYPHPIAGWWNSVTYQKDLELKNFDNSTYYKQIYNSSDAVIYKVL